eukprot:883276-Rhodomonas_salina.1
MRGTDVEVEISGWCGSGLRGTKVGLSSTDLGLKGTDRGVLDTGKGPGEAAYNGGDQSAPLLHCRLPGTP